MGALHQGHARLVEVARSECDFVVVSIFVNPLQFDREEDLDRYPRTLAADLDICGSLQVDAVFAPAPAEMYRRPQASVVHVRRLADHLCGAHRPGHFEGVATVVLKLFHIVQPARAYFGEKDAQQLAIVRRMVDDLNLPIAIVGVPTVRESDGLAMSSRNHHLTPEERVFATSLFRALTSAAEQIRGGARRPHDITRTALATIPAHPDIRLEYLELVDPEELQPVTDVTGRVLVAGAMWVGATRLIDNMVVTP
jgi:pantoate--beta-alanine ligase